MCVVNSQRLFFSKKLVDTFVSFNSVKKENVKKNEFSHDDKIILLSVATIKQVNTS